MTSLYQNSGKLHLRAESFTLYLAQPPMKILTSFARVLPRTHPVFLSTFPALSMAQQQPAKTDVPWSVRKYTPRHTSWPYSLHDFARHDETNDVNFYKTSRFVTHIDDEAIARLRRYYEQVLPRSGCILDFCSSWISHYPIDIEGRIRDGNLEVIGLGMNQTELDDNPVLITEHSRIVADLNVSPDVAAAVGKRKFDAATCAVSIDYLTQPNLVLSSLKGCMKNDGDSVHLVISNRCFPTKAIKRWLQVGEEERLQMVGDYLHFAGWKDIEIVDLKVEREAGKHTDPLWVVRGRKGIKAKYS